MRLIGTNKSSNGRVWKVFGGVALAAFAAVVIVNFQDIKRMIKIHMM